MEAVSENKPSDEQMLAWEQQLREAGWDVDDLGNFRKQLEQEMAWTEDLLDLIYAARSKMKSVQQVQEWEAERHRVETRLGQHRRIHAALVRRKN